MDRFLIVRSDFVLTLPAGDILSPAIFFIYGQVFSVKCILLYGGVTR